MLRWLAAATITILAVLSAASGGEDPNKKPEPLKIVAATEDEKKAWLEKETQQQKALRAELSAMKGSRIVFNANLGENNANALFMMSPDGSELKKLTTGKDAESYPHVSFDGKRLIFERKESLSAEEQKKVPFDPDFPFKKENRAEAGKPVPYVWVSDLDGANARRLAQGYGPHWAPNGKAVAYTFAQLYGRVHKAALFDIEKNVEKAIWRVNPCSQCFPAFSPDGKWLLLSNGPAVYVPMNEGCTDLAAPDAKLVAAVNGHPCNAEISPDGKWIAWVVDTAKCLGGWLCYAKYDPAGKPAGQNLELGVAKDSVNYFPDFSPDSKYLVYVHAEQQAGVQSWTLTTQQDVFICRFPADGVSVRVTWTNAACQHPNWRNVAK